MNPQETNLPSEPPKDAKGGLPTDFELENTFLTQNDFWTIEEHRAGCEGARWMRDQAQPLIDSQAAQIAELKAKRVENEERIDWLTGQREIECRQKEAALNESGECLKERDSLRTQLSAREQQLAESRDELEKVHRDWSADFQRVTNINAELQRKLAESLTKLDGTVSAGMFTKERELREAVEAQLATLRAETVSREVVEGYLLAYGVNDEAFKAFHKKQISETYFQLTTDRLRDARNVLESALQPASADSAPEFTPLGVGDVRQEGDELKARDSSELRWTKILMNHGKVINKKDFAENEYRRPNKKPESEYPSDDPERQYPQKGTCAALEDGIKQANAGQETYIEPKCEPSAGGVGDGWRELGLEEPIETGDEFLNGSWYPANVLGHLGKLRLAFPYRRRISQPKEAAKPTGRKYSSVRELIVGEGMSDEVLKRFDELAKVNPSNSMCLKDKPPEKPAWEVAERKLCDLHPWTETNGISSAAQAIIREACEARGEQMVSWRDEMQKEREDHIESKRRAAEKERDSARAEVERLKEHLAGRAV